jgi:hypothetical protein
LFRRIIASLFGTSVDEQQEPVCDESRHTVENFPDHDQYQTVVHSVNQESLFGVCLAFRQAEQDIKTVELESYGEDLNIPSINELRYVGHHLCKVFQENITAEDQAEELKRALRHCERASYDAVELGIISQLEAISIFQKDYKKDNIISQWSEYVADMNKVQAAKNFIEAHSIQRERENYFRECGQWYADIASVVRTSEVVRPLLNSARFRGRKQLALSFVFGSFAAAGALTLTLLQVVPFDTLKNEWNNVAVKGEFTKTEQSGNLALQVEKPVH